MKGYEKKINMHRLNRVYYFDSLRAMACLMVVIIHVGAVYINKDFGSLNFWVGNILVSLSRIAVPVFVMISGALMLDENYVCTGKKIAKHIGKLILFFFFWSFASCFLFEIAIPVLKKQPLDYYKIFTEIVQGPYHLWFIYMIIGLYLIVPILRLLIRTENKKIIEYFLVLSFIFTFFFGEMVRVGGYFSNVFVFLNDHLFKEIGMQFVGGYTAYFILGWYLHNYEITHKKLLYGLGIGGFVYTVLSSYIFSMLAGESVISSNNLSLNILFQTVTVFLLFKERDKKCGAKETVSAKLIGLIAKHSLGVYALHVIIFTTILDVFIKIGLTNALIAIPLNVIFSFVASLFISFILSKMPLIKKVV